MDADLAGHPVTTPYRASRSVLVDGHPVRLLTEPLLLDDLDAGDWFIGLSGELYEVSCPAATHPNGWTEATNLSMPVETERALLAGSGGGEPDTGPREGFFTFPGQDVVIDRVLELVPATGQAPAGEQGTSVLGALTARWVASDPAPARADGGNAAGPIHGSGREPLRRARVGEPEPRG